MPDSTSKIGRNVIALKHESIFIKSSQKSPSSFQSFKTKVPGRFSTGSNIPLRGSPENNRWVGHLRNIGECLFADFLFYNISFPYM